MSTQTSPNPQAQPDAGVAAANETGKQPAQRAISDPREVAAVVLGRMKSVRKKNDEFAAAINGLLDITQQLARAYAEQRVTIDRLRKRVRELESAAAGAMQPPSMVQ